MHKTDSFSKNYSLSIRFKSDGFSLYIRDEHQLLISSKTTNLDKLPETEEDFIDILSKEEELNINYQKVNFLYETDTYTIVPSQIFSPKNAKELLSFQHQNQIKNSDHITYNTLQAWNAVLIYSIPRTMYFALKKVLPEIEIEHHLHSFIYDSIKLNKSSNVQTILRYRKLDIIVLENGNLTLINSFDYEKAEDALYQITNVYEQLSLNRESCKLTIHNSKMSPNLTEMTKKYFRNFEYFN